MRGFTILELAVASTIAILMLAAVYAVTSESTDTARLGTAMAVLEGQASRTLDRIATELVAAGLETLEPPDPLGVASLTFRKATGADAGKATWGPRESIGLRSFAGDREVVWVRDLDDEDGPREVVLCGSVRGLAEGEAGNGADDNGNGLADEEGLSFELSGRTLTIRLSLEVRDRVGGVLTRTVSTSIKLRN
ncbi:MAG TPA: hypothetical protein VFY93_05330 [Planctomycetota bacterium]|nr:hypothetical protein [Planctomycetota bacterium]